MAAATNNGEIKELSLPGLRAWSLTASDTNTFTPGNIKPVKAWAEYDADPSTGNQIGCTVSSGVVTINCTGLSSTDIILFVVGKD